MSSARINQARRRDFKLEGWCITAASHGKATHGVLCERCRLLHRYGRKRRPEVWQRVDMLSRELRRIETTKPIHLEA